MANTNLVDAEGGQFAKVATLLYGCPGAQHYRSDSVRYKAGSMAFGPRRNRLAKLVGFDPWSMADGLIQWSSRKKPGKKERNMVDTFSYA
ncbi:hypothetical protein E2562_001202 [Oryza meyeriana var. granulata]|uniref:Uncharacterized protein n=1 Tax=Oryza meyeriana var. granulata TaxID=110450 RepID=A0A6G1DBZ7_9ORYZ|nr:hypothetical protein E2562_001202 [Oryza meyeriana var. granulata]